MPVVRGVGLRGSRGAGLVPGGFRRFGFAAILSSLVLIAATPKRSAVDVVHLRDGDRISGKVKGTTDKSVRLETPYGRLLIPREKIEKIRYADGREVVLVQGAPLPPQPVLLELDIAGDSFWQAWDPEEVPVDPALRLLIAVDGLPVAAYLDRKLDPDIAGAVVNTFAFEPAQTARTLWNETRAHPPAIAPGRAALKLELLPAVYGTRKLILKYQVNLGEMDEAVWRDLAEAAAEFEAVESAPTRILVTQSRGTMSFGGMFHKKRMRNVETFSLTLEPAGESKAE